MSLRALDDDQVLDRYLDVKAEIDRLTRELDGLKPVLTAALKPVRAQRREAA